MTAIAATGLVTALGPDSPDDGEPGRQQRGLAIAALVPISEHKLGYMVPSQSGRGQYIVSIDEDSRFCTCPDYALRQRDCKHLVAVQLTAHRRSAVNGQPAHNGVKPAEAVNGTPTEAMVEAPATVRPKTIRPKTIRASTLDADTKIEDSGGVTGHDAGDAPEEKTVADEERKKPKKPTYQRDWRRYDMSKEYEEDHFDVLAADIASLILQPVYDFGRPHLSLADVIYSLIRKAYTGQSRRIVMSSLRRAESKRLVTRAPSSGALTDYQKDPALTPILKHLIQQTTLPLWGLDNGVFASDGTGFSTRVYDRWFEHKWGKEAKRAQWVKAHCAFGTKTKIVTAVEVSTGNAHDSPFLPDLIHTTLTNHEVTDMCVDLGYLDNEHFELADGLNIDLMIPFKSNSKESSPDRRPDGPWERAYHYFHLHHEKFLERYHQRSISETGFSMIKGRFGGFVRGRTLTAQFNEVLCKVLAHNICCLITAMYEFDLDLSFGNGDSRLKLPSAYYRAKGSRGLSIYGTLKPEPQPQPKPRQDEGPEPLGGPLLAT